MTFDDLLEQLPACPGADALPVSVRTGGLKYEDKGLPEFIGPDIQPSAIIQQPGQPKVIIISAAGAVGKSTLAAEIAHRKRAPIWDLAKAEAVGGNSLTGQVTTAFGFGTAAQVSQQFLEGGLFLLIDALDEARVKANEAGYEAFVANIAEIAKGAARTPFVLLGRTQTAETTWLLLDDVGIPASLLTIQPFTREQAERYIEARIRYFDASARRRIEEHRVPFLEARNLILDHLQRAVIGDERVTDDAAREFLGYAPVLETVAVLLAKEGNYHEFIESLNAMGRQEIDRPLAVLNHVVTRLLEREQTQKLQVNIKPVLEAVAEEAGWDSWSDLYSPDEQVARLLGLILGRRVEACPAMPSSVRARYEEQLKVWLPEHPFLREGSVPANQVFESYLFADAMREYLTPLARAVEDRVMASDYKPSRLLADFYILLGQKRGEDCVAERQIGILYDSLLAGETDSMRIRLAIESGDPEDDEEEVAGEGEFELVYSSPDPNGEERVETRVFRIDQPGDALAFRRQLKEATVVTRGTLVLGGEVDDFEIGPSVQVRCQELVVRSTGFVVRGAGSREAGSEAVVLDAQRCDSAVARKPLVRGSLTACWPGSESYPWSEYSTASVDYGRDSPHMQEAYRRLRRIVTALQSHSKGSLARLKDKIEHQRILKNNMGRALLDRLLGDGIMYVKGKFYHWNPERGDEALGASYDDFCRQWLTPETRVYLDAFVEQHEHLF
jgi:hypothetical protein